ncbi:MAG TPA: plastocyanin/azurin family copper-binding protein [Gemmatimonadaceae bacterium]
MSGTAFNPAAIQVSPGAKVTWTNSDNISHNVTFSSPSISTPNFSSGSQSLDMPAAVGEYSYRCTLHAGMNGTVTVK